MKLRTGLLAATVLALPVAVTAQPVSGPYVGLGAGINIMANNNLTSASIPVANVGRQINQNVNMRNGFVGLGSAGWGFGNGVRAEIEGNFRQNGFQSTGNYSWHGLENKYGVMVNGLYDFNLKSFGLNTTLMPYVGAGVGYNWVSMQNVRAYPNGVPGLNAVVDGSEGAFAYQGIVGLGIPIAAVPGLAITTEYRYFGVAGRNYTGAIGAPAGTFGVGSPAVGTHATAKFNDDHNNSLLIGLRYAFNAAPPPPPPPPPAPVPASISRNYLVFFDWDRYDLTDRARAIISEAAANSKKVATTHIQVNGFTDTSGSAAYNMKLSVRRAQTVAAELVKDGVPKNEISIKGFGQTHLLVPTADGVREPQNRRVEIILE